LKKKELFESLEAGRCLLEKRLFLAPPDYRAGGAVQMDQMPEARAAAAAILRF
jgi:hypothetical protein